MQCYNHVDRPASGACHHCQRALCASCTDHYQPPLCEACFERDTRVQAQTHWWRLSLTLFLWAAGTAGVTFALRQWVPNAPMAIGISLGWGLVSMYWGWVTLSQWGSVWFIGAPWMLVMYWFAKVFLCMAVGTVAAPVQIILSAMRLHSLRRERAALGRDITRSLFDERMKRRIWVAVGVTTFFMLPGMVQSVFAGGSHERRAATTRAATTRAATTRAATTRGDAESIAQRKEAQEAQTAIATAKSRPSRLEPTNTREFAASSISNTVSNPDVSQTVAWPGSRKTRRIRTSVRNAPATVVEPSAEGSQAGDRRPEGWKPRSEPWVGADGRLIIPAPPP